MLLILFFLIVTGGESKSQSLDSIQAKVLSINKLKECDLIRVVSMNNVSDTVVLISPHKSMSKKDIRKLNVGESYFFVFEKDIVIASPPKKMSVKYKNTIVWTNKESYKLKPKLCLNCSGEYIKL